MLRRNSSRKTNRRPLSRSKSTNSVVRRPIHDFESMDPAEAARDANIAAVLSYQRAQDRPRSEGMSLPHDPASFYLDRSDGTSSVIRHSPQRTDSAMSRNGTSDISRRRSVRFTGPSAAPRRNIASRANGGRDSPAKATSKFSLTERYLETLQPPDACYNPQDDVDSISSSFKKVRKSRSMMTSSNVATGGVSTRDWSANHDMRPRSSPLPPKNNEPPKNARSQTSALRAVASMSFLKSRRKMAASQASDRVEDNDAALRLARERFRQIQEEEERKKQHSALLRPKTRESEASTVMRKSLRNSSNNSTAVASTFSTNSASVSKQHGIRNTARKVSHGLRSKLRGLFGKGKSEDSEQEGYEQCVAVKDSDGESCLHAGDPDAAEEASMFRVTSHIPSLHDVPSNQQLRSRKGSVESFGDVDHSVSDDRSRVTSWTNSMTNTVTSQGTLGDRERQRLSVIRESGTHVASPLHSAEPLQQQTRDMIAEMSINSERVYSALIERLGQKGTAEQIETGSIATTENDFEKNRELCESMNKQWPHSTIRCVRPDDDMASNHERTSSTSSSATEVPDKDANRASEIIPAGTPRHKIPWDWSDDNAESEHTSVLLNGLDPYKTISQRSSAFFASPDCHSFREPSPYRRALREMNSSDEMDGGLPGSQYLHSLSTLNLPVRQDSNHSSEKDYHAADVESVYSLSADDATPLPTPRVADLLGPSPGRRHTRNQPPDIPIYVSAHEHQRDTSTASSVEWKTWLSSKVSKLEGPSTPRRQQDNGVLPLLGHVREGASMGSTPELRTSTNERPSSRTPLGSVKGNTQSFPDSPTRSSRQIMIGYDENSAPNRNENTSDKGTTPSIPRRSTLRTVPSMPSVVPRGNLIETGPGKEMQRMKSLNAIGYLTSTPEGLLTKRRSQPRVAGWQGSPSRSSPGVGARANAMPAGSSGPGRLR
uniref:WGS project CBMI000000000 data, contig CS3069_c001325 n=1 Tax=Fusarium clavum TaxID=2594811 RepID=A0A090N5G8_9HYPO|nr:unnamed protein product [Fusarium clavum]